MIAVKTVFLDRDGVINSMRSDYVKCWGEFAFLPRAKEALKLLKEAGMRLIIVTNQRGIARGLMSEADLDKIHEQLHIELASVGIQIAAIYHCPHDEGQCSCRKPHSGMFLQAQKDFPDIDFANSVVIGDSLADLEAGARVGCRTLLIADVSCEKCTAEDAHARHFVIDGIAPSLFEAVVNYLVPAV